MKQFFVLLQLFILIFYSANSQEIKKVNELILSNFFIETSGLQIVDDYIISINDSGSYPSLYFVDTITGDTTRVEKLPEIFNKDWESLAREGDNLYIGDFGNNGGVRKDLKIFKIDKNYNVIDTIFFKYELQSNFEYSRLKTEFDCEAFFVKNNFAYLFTKNWKQRETSLYCINLNEKNTIAYHILDIDVKALITGSDYNLEENKIICSAYEYGFPIKSLIFIIDFDFDKRCVNSVLRYSLPDIGRQTEAVVWKNNFEIYLSNEYRRNQKAMLCKYDISALMNFDIDNCDLRIKYFKKRSKETNQKNVIKLKARTKNFTYLKFYNCQDSQLAF